MTLSDKSTIELMNMYAQILTELKARSVIRTYNSPIGDYAEWLVSKKLGLTLEKNSKKGYDAYEPSTKTRYQIKSRWERGTPCAQSRELSVIRNYEENQFDSLIVLIFNAYFKVKEAYAIPHNVILQYARYSKHQNGHILIAMGPVLKDTHIEDLTSQFE